jgi:hypothetical protein
LVAPVGKHILRHVQLAGFVVPINKQPLQLC